MARRTSNVVVRLRGMSVSSSSSRRSAGSVARRDRRRLVDARRQVRQEAPGHRHRLLLGLGEVVDRAVAAVDLPAAEVLLGDVVAHGVADDRRAGDEQLGDVAHHHREVAEHGLGRADADDAAEQHVDDRHGGQLLGVLGAAEVAGQERAAAAADARPAGLDGARALLGRALARLRSARAPSPPRCRRPTSRRAGGSRGCAAASTAGRGSASFGPIAPSAWPPREVKSSAQTMPARPSIVPQPPTWLAGVNAATSPSSS